MALCVAGAIISIVEYINAVRARLHVARETRCRRCGHALRGLTEPKCSECGEVI